MRHTGFVPAQRAAEPLAAVATMQTSIAPFLRLLTAPSARADGSQKKNIFQLPQGLYQIRPGGAVRPDTYSSCTWLVPPCVRAESRLSDRRLLVSGLSEAHGRRKLNSIGRTYFRGSMASSQANRGPTQAGSDAEHFCGFPPECKLQLNFQLMSPSSTFVAEHVG